MLIEVNKNFEVCWTAAVAIIDFIYFVICFSPLRFHFVS